MTRLALLLVPLAIAYGACGGQASSVAAGGSDGGGGGDASTDAPATAPSPLTGALVPACPSAPAAIGGACTPVGQLCEYGDDANSTCNVVRHCSPSARWESASDGSGKTCSSTLRACAGDPSGGTCAPLSEICATSHGVCTCVDTSGPPRPDAGGPSSAWTCSSPNPVCPAWPARPRIGSACSMPELQCDYAACGPTGFAFRCDAAGYWTDSFSSPCGGG